MVYLYSTIKIMHGPINIRFTNINLLYFAFNCQSMLKCILKSNKNTEKYTKITVERLYSDA